MSLDNSPSYLYESELICISIDYSLDNIRIISTIKFVQLYFLIFVPKMKIHRLPTFRTSLL